MNQTPPGAAPEPKTTTSKSPESSQPARTKPRVSLALATAFGLGYLPKAPGTFGSLGGVAISAGLVSFISLNIVPFELIPYLKFTVVLLVAIFGVAVANRAAAFAGQEDPQFVVIDEVSGQMITYFLAFTVLNWKSWLLGFILFRVFDIWKPFPARQAESLPGGLGIMADDWIAGIYAALGLWIVHTLRFV
jgi:phosphatidylglycerophosphatase A